MPAGCLEIPFIFGIDIGIRIHPQYGPVPASSKIAQSREFVYSSYDWNYEQIFFIFVWCFLYFFGGLESPILYFWEMSEFEPGELP
jgi:hypothetical protein